MRSLNALTASASSSSSSRSGLLWGEDDPQGHQGRREVRGRDDEEKRDTRDTGLGTRAGISNFTPIHHLVRFFFASLDDAFSRPFLRLPSFVSLFLGPRLASSLTLCVRWVHIHTVHTVFAE